MPVYVPSTGNKPPWFERSALGIPEPIDGNDADAQVLVIYAEAGRYYLVTAADPRDIQNARITITKINPAQLQATLRAAETYPEQFDADGVALVKRLMAENPKLNAIESAHRATLKFYGDTRVLRLALLWNTATGLIEPLKAKVEAGLKAGNPDPREMAAWEPIQTAIDQKQNQQQGHQDDVHKAYLQGHSEGQGQSSDMETRVAQLEAELAAERALNAQMAAELAAKKGGGGTAKPPKAPKPPKGKGKKAPPPQGGTTTPVLVHGSSDTRNTKR